MVEPQESRFWKAALQSGLIDADNLQACWDAIVPEKRVSDQIDRRLARQAVHAGMVTLWQAQQLLAGKSSGFKINRYTLLDLIGQGGMGRVYLAKDTRLNRQVALKILSPERVNNPRAIARFQREARVGAQLQHENLVRIYDEGEANGKCYLVMEFIEGKNIGSMIADNGPIPYGIAAKLIRQVALGLEHAQLKGLIHRDVNPYNILVTKDTVAKLTDLGLAIDLAENDQVTRDGATVGTFDYVSPEQARHSHSVDTRSDIYSLGCSLYHMLAGRVPFPSPSLPEKLFHHQSIEPDSLLGIVPGIPEGLVEVVRKMMSKQPEDRYQSPKDVAHALEPYVEGLEFSSNASRDEVSSVRAIPSAAPTKISGHIEPTPPPSPTSAAEPSPGLDLGINFGGEPAQPAAAGFDLGIALDLGGESTPAAKAAPAPKAEPAATPKPAPVKPSPPAAAEPPKPAAGGIDLGIALDFGGESAPAAPAPAKAPAPPKAEPPAPQPAPPPKPAAAKPAPPPPKPSPEESPALPPDFAFGVGGVEKPADDALNLGLNLGLDTAPPPKKAAPPPKAPAPAKVEQPAAPQPPPAKPPAAKPAPPPSKPAPEETPALPPDFAFGVGGDEKPAEGGLNLGLNLGLDTAPPPKKAAPAAKAPEPAPAPVVPAPPKPAPVKPAAPPKPAPEPAPLDFGLSLGGEKPADDALNLGLNLNLAAAPAERPAPAKTPVAPKPTPPPKPAPAPPAPAPEPVPDFALSLSGEKPAEEAGGLGLGLDLGPAPSIAPAKPAPKKPAPAPVPQAVEEEDEDEDEEEDDEKETQRKPRKVDRRFLIGAAAGGVLLLVIVGVVLGLGLLGGKDEKPTTAKGKPAKTSKGTAVATSTKPKKSKETPEGKPREKPEVAVNTKPAAPRKKSAFDEPAIPEGQGFAVLAPDGTVVREPDLKGAMSRAVGSKGRVLLDKSEPIKLSGDDAAINLSGGRLTIAAKKGVQPVLEVEVKGETPWLLVRSESPLTLIGVTIVARYPTPHPKPAPVILAASEVTLTNCVFRATGSVAKTSVVAAKGFALTATGCFFENFDCALDFDAFGTHTATIRQCMMVRPKADAQPIGWAVRLRNFPGQATKVRKVILDRCTVKGKGLIELVDFKPDYPCRVEVKECAVLADSILAWQSGDVPVSPEALQWAGVGNKYDIQGKSWIVTKPDGSQPAADSPSDLESWNKRFTERDATGGPLKFQTEISSLPAENTAPIDFTIPDQGDLKIGADPNSVGPSAKPPRK